MPVRTIRIIWLALLMSILIYGLVIFVAIPQVPSTPFQSAFSNPIIVVLHVVGFMLFLSSYFVSSFQTGTVTVNSRTHLALIIRWALLESSAVFGLLSAFLAQDPRVYAPLGALAVIGMLASYPGDDA